MIPEQDCSRLIVLFDSLFAASHDTVLRHGGEEPLYLPAQGGKPSCILFAHGFFSSALHEVAHWCIAGKRRRRMRDYGYWYVPSGRDRAQQEAFQSVEVKPQALEWAFSLASGQRFVCSADNLDGDGGDMAGFKENVRAQARAYAAGGFPARAEIFIAGLCTTFGRVRPVASDF